MTRIMFGPLILLAASVSPPARPVPPASNGVVSFKAVGGATARATVSIRILSGVSFGEGRLAGGDGGLRRKGQLADADGTIRPVELIEFQ